MPIVYPSRRVSKRAKSRMYRRYSRAKKSLGKNQTRAVKAIVNKTLNRVIETKESTRTSTTNINMPHNNTYIVQDASAGGNLNPFTLAQGTADPMAGNSGNRIGDQISPKGLLVKGMIEASLGRSKVHCKVMLLRGPQGAPFTRADIFKGNSQNKLLDQINTEKYKVISITRFNVQSPNNVASGVSATGVPLAGIAAGIPGNKVFSLWVPGKAFGRPLKYENGSTTQLKYFDYRLVILSYDFFGTPQDVNNVLVLNEIYTKLYYKDA